MALVIPRREIDFERGRVPLFFLFFSPPSSSRRRRIELTRLCVVALQVQSESLRERGRWPRERRDWHRRRSR